MFVFQHQGREGFGRPLTKVFEEAVVQLTCQDLLALIVGQSRGRQALPALFVARWKMVAQPSPSLRFERQRRHVGLWVHARTAGQRAHWPGRAVERCAFADGDVAYLTRQAMVCEQRTVANRFEREEACQSGARQSTNASSCASESVERTPQPRLP